MSKKKKPKPENKSDWAFEPKLGYEIEPKLTDCILRIKTGNDFV